MMVVTINKANLIWKQASTANIVPIIIMILCVNPYYRYEHDHCRFYHYKYLFIINILYYGFDINVMRAHC